MEKWNDSFPDARILAFCLGSLVKSSLFLRRGLAQRIASTLRRQMLFRSSLVRPQSFVPIFRASEQNVHRNPDQFVFLKSKNGETVTSF